MFSGNQSTLGGDDSNPVKFNSFFTRRPTWIQTAIISSLTNYYAVLSVGRDATDQEVTQAWRALVLAHHPDRHNRPTGVDVRLINEARWVLSDPQRRAEWERAFFKGGESCFYADRRWR